MANEKLFPHVWPTATVTHRDIVTAIAQQSVWSWDHIYAHVDYPEGKEDFETVPVGSDRKGRLLEFFYVNDEQKSVVRELDPPQIRLVNRIIQRFYESLSAVSHGLLLSWTTDFRANYKDAISRSTRQVRDDVAYFIDYFQWETGPINAQFAKLESLKEAASIAVELPRLRRHHRSIRMHEIGAFTRALFSSGIALALPVGLLLFEGRTSETLKERDNIEEDVESFIRQGLTQMRTRAVSTSWHPGAAMIYASIKPFKSVKKSQESILMVHKIVSPSVRAVDVMTVGQDNGFAMIKNKEVMLQPYTRYHVCKDDTAVLYHGDANANGYENGPYPMRVLYTHVFVEDACPLCNAMDE